MNGLVFVWCSWIMLVVFVFFLSHRINLYLIAHLFIIIFLSQFFIPLEGISVNVASLYMIMVICIQIAKLTVKNQLLVIVSSFIIALAQGCYYLFTSLEPLWFVWIPTWANGFLLLYLAILLLKQNSQRMMALLMGMVISDLLLFIVQFRLGLNYEMFSLAWLDQIAIVSIMLLIWYMIESVGHYFLNDNKHYHKKEV